jgi:acetolactate synthase-1/2/3 large subunit
MIQKKPVHAAIAECLAFHDVDTLFGLIGDANLFMVDSYVRDVGGRYISAANEAAAVLMAIGYAQVSGRIGVATVTHGPGLTNTVTSLAEGVKAGIAIVVIAGDTSAEDFDHLQKIPQREVVTSSGAGFEQLRSPATVAEDVARAFRRAELERRPIVLNTPADFQWQDIEYRPVRRKIVEGRPVIPESDELDNAIGIIAAAKRPVVIGGRGVANAIAEDAILKFASRIGAPVATTLRGRGSFHGSDRNLGIFGTLSSATAAGIIIASDCIIAFGASLNRFTTSHGSFLQGKRVIQVNLDRSDIGKFATVDAGLAGDLGLTAELLVKWLDEAEVLSSGYFDNEMSTILASGRDSVLPVVAHKSPPGTIDLGVALTALNRAVPLDRIVVADTGRFIGEAWRCFGVIDPRSFVYTTAFAAIGLGVPEAIGASVAANGRSTVLLSGDGGFMLGGIAEFNTAVRHNIDLVVIICNDSSYGAEHVQFRNRQMDPSLSLFKWPNFATLARALGGDGVTVKSPSDLDLAIRAIQNRTGPVLIDLVLDADCVAPIPH